MPAQCSYMHRMPNKALVPLNPKNEGFIPGASTGGSIYVDGGKGTSKGGVYVGSKSRFVIIGGRQTSIHVEGDLKISGRLQLEGTNLPFTLKPFTIPIANRRTVLPHNIPNLPSRVVSYSVHFLILHKSSGSTHVDFDSREGAVKITDFNFEITTMRTFDPEFSYSVVIALWIT
eukprot:NODE_1179_length_1249_cov_133.250000_g959_i0.p1 GENE.NODE_1179_length_1249_cov_133.250000_g959_i0~~NODE_1179_length_1249_cov_133.250000_g959_i0.p1  ORF type:complete len:174 (-),score=14.78 NODE_1179_length_1249_cov_133.250000_g959_i0:154-675(-)